LLVETEMIAADHITDSHRRRSPWHPEEAGFSKGALSTRRSRPRGISGRNSGSGSPAQGSWVAIL
jgi:hypothetical protein